MKSIGSCFIVKESRARADLDFPAPAYRYRLQLWALMVSAAAAAAAHSQHTLSNFRRHAPFGHPPLHRQLARGRYSLAWAAAFQMELLTASFMARLAPAPVNLS